MSHYTPRIHFFAAFLPDSCNKDDIIDEANVRFWCDQRPCHVWKRPTPILANPAPATHLDHGDGIELRISPPRRSRDADDEMAFMQFAAIAPDPGRPLPFRPDQYAALHLVVVYRLGRPPRRVYARPQSYEDMVGHIAALLHIDEMDVHGLHEIEAVLPGEIDGAHSVLLNQAGDVMPGNTGQFHLLDIEYHDYDETVRPPHVDRTVAILASQVSRRGLLRFAGLDAYCEDQRQRCLVYVNNEGWPILDERLRTYGHGQYFRIVVPPPERPPACGTTTRELTGQPERLAAPAPTVAAAGVHHTNASEASSSNDTMMSGYAPTTPDHSRHADADLEDEAGDQAAMLQLGPNRCPTVDAVAQAPRPVGPRLNMAGVIDTFNWLDTHFSLVQYCLPPSSPDWPWHAASIPWLNLPWYDPDERALEIVAYFDGAYLRATDQAGAGVVVFIRTDQGWTFGGATSDQPPATAAGAYDAELRAALIALKVIHDHLKIIVHHHPAHAPPFCTVCFDNEAVGWQSAGFWKSASDKPEVASLRSLVRLIEHRFYVTVDHRHVPGHQGDPGNEAADVIAGAAAKGHTLGSWATFLEGMGRKTFSNLLEWSWFLFQNNYTDWDGLCLRLPARPCAQEQPDEMPAGDSDPSSTGYVVDYEAVAIPPALRGYPRIDALQAQGPMQLPSSWIDRECHDIEQQLADTAEHDNDPLPPPEGPALEQALAQLTQGWFQRFLDRGGQTSEEDELQDLWLQCLGEVLPDKQEAAGVLFLRWGQCGLPDLLATFVDWLI
eukprot:Skav233446  [mRNA]  locus=scaffold1486:348941:354938:- [translate_table: standard]